MKAIVVRAVYPAKELCVDFTVETAVLHCYNTFFGRKITEVDEIIYNSKQKDQVLKNAAKITSDISDLADILDDLLKLAAGVL